MTKSDLHALKSNGESTENIINASQKLLSLQHCRLKGFQETHLGSLLKFSTLTEPGVQILHVYWYFNYSGLAYDFLGHVL